MGWKRTGEKKVPYPEKRSIFVHVPAMFQPVFLSALFLVQVPGNPAVSLGLSTVRGKTHTRMGGGGRVARRVSGTPSRTV